MIWIDYFEEVILIRGLNYFQAGDPGASNRAFN